MAAATQGGEVAKLARAEEIGDWGGGVGHGERRVTSMIFKKHNLSVGTISPFAL